MPHPAVIPTKRSTGRNPFFAVRVSGNVITGTKANTLGTHNPLRYRGYVYDTETGLYYLQSRYYDPATGRFINADEYVSTGQGVLGTNMFSYCLNNPVNLRDSGGYYPYYANDPAGELGRLLGEWLYDLLEKETEEDQEKINDGTVSYSSNGKSNGARISNSHEIDTPWVMYHFVKENRSDDIDGTTIGVVYEWVFHNIAYDIGEAFGLDSISNSAKDVDVGKTIFADKRDGINAKSVMSFGMKFFYICTSPAHSAYDLVVEMKG